jgi:hypothetical protein
MKHLLLIGLLALGPVLSSCKGATSETPAQRAIDQCQDTKGSHGNNHDCIR